MNSIKKLMASEKALIGLGMAKMFQTAYLIISVLLCVELAALVYLEADNNIMLIFDVLVTAFMSMAMFWMSGYFHMNPTGRFETASCCSIVRMAYFMPFTKGDYVKAGLIKWAEFQLFFCLFQTAMIILTMVLGNPLMREFIGTDYFLVNAVQIIMGILAMLPNVLGLKKIKGNFWFIVNIGVFSALLILLTATERFMPFSRTYLFGGYCSVLGIIGGFMVIPVVAVITLLIMQVKDKRAWFRN